MLGSASLKHSSPPATAALPRRDESNMTLHGRRVSPSKAPFHTMFFPAGVDAAALIVPSARTAAGTQVRRAIKNVMTRDVFNMRLRLGNWRCGRVAGWLENLE